MQKNWDYQLRSLIRIITHDIIIQLPTKIAKINTLKWPRGSKQHLKGNAKIYQDVLSLSVLSSTIIFYCPICISPFNHLSVCIFQPLKMSDNVPEWTKIRTVIKRYTKRLTLIKEKPDSRKRDLLINVYRLKISIETMKLENISLQGVY